MKKFTNPRFSTLFLASALSIFLSAYSSNAQFKDGNKLLTDCQNNQGINLGYCLGYVAAIADGMIDAMVNGRTACIPNGVTQGQLRDIVVGKLIASPANRHLSADVLVAQAIADTYPCADRRSNDGRTAPTNNPFR